MKRISYLLFPFIIITLLLSATSCSTRPGCESNPEPLQGKNFISEADWIYNYLVAAGVKAPLGMNNKTWNEYKQYIQKCINSYRSEFLEPFERFMADKRPADLPATVIYPFGGSDLSTAIATYPNASEITTISLEGAGDPQIIVSCKPDQMYLAFEDFRSVLGSFLSMQDNTNDNVRASDKGIVPGQISLSIAEAYIFGYKPVSLRFFSFLPDGSLHYYTAEEISFLKNNHGERLHPAWALPEYSVAFRNMEIQYIKHIPSSEKTLVHRHIAANLHDSRYIGSPLSAHLEKKRKISAMSKAGSYLLWRRDFTGIREYLLKHMIFMVADSTGILPRHSSEAGFDMVTYGKFKGAFLDDDGGTDAEELRLLFKSQPVRELPVRYGYSDIRRSNHIILYFPKSKH